MSYGDTVEFKCIAEGSPSPLQMWLHNGQPLGFSDRFRLNEESTILTISGVRAGDEGELTCRAENVLGRIETSVNIRVSSGTPPVFTDYLQNSFR